MTDDELSRLLDEYRDACVAYKENCDALSVATEARKWRDAARAAIIAAWEEREGADRKYRFIRSHDPSDEWRDLPESEAQAFDRVVERAMAQVAARTEGKGNG